MPPAHTQQKLTSITSPRNNPFLPIEATSPQRRATFFCPRGGNCGERFDCIRILAETFV